MDEKRFRSRYALFRREEGKEIVKRGMHVHAWLVDFEEHASIECAPGIILRSSVDNRQFFEEKLFEVELMERMGVEVFAADAIALEGFLEDVERWKFCCVGALEFLDEVDRKYQKVLDWRREHILGVEIV